RVVTGSPARRWMTPPGSRGCRSGWARVTENTSRAPAANTDQSPFGARTGSVSPDGTPLRKNVTSRAATASSGSLAKTSRSTSATSSVSERTKIGVARPSNASRSCSTASTIPATARGSALHETLPVARYDRPPAAPARANMSTRTGRSNPSRPIITARTNATWTGDDASVTGDGVGHVLQERVVEDRVVDRRVVDRQPHQRPGEGGGHRQQHEHPHLSERVRVGVG